MVSCIQPLLPDTAVVWSSTVTSLTITGRIKFKYMTAECYEKTTFGLFELVLFTSSASKWHFHLSSLLIGSSAHIPIGGSASPHTPHLPSSHTQHICLCVFTASLYNDSQSFALTYMSISSQTTKCRRTLLTHQKKHQEEKMWFHLNENKPSKAMLQTLCSKAISGVPEVHPIKAEPNTRGIKHNYCTSHKRTINA